MITALGRYAKVAIVNKRSQVLYNTDGLPTLICMLHEKPNGGCIFATVVYEFGFSCVLFFDTVQDVVKAKCGAVIPLWKPCF